MFQGVLDSVHSVKCKAPESLSHRLNKNLHLVRSHDFGDRCTVSSFLTGDLSDAFATCVPLHDPRRLRRRYDDSGLFG